MERVTIEIETVNSAFDESPATEVARILRELACAFEDRGCPATVIRDPNGNRIGFVRIIKREY